LSIVDNALQTLGKSTGPTQALGELGRAANPMAHSVAHELYRGGAPAAPGKPWALWAAMALVLLGAATWWLLDRAKPAAPAAPAYPVAALAQIPAALPAPVLAANTVALAPITSAAQIVEAEKKALPTIAAPAAKTHLLPPAPHPSAAPAPRLADKAVVAYQTPPASAVLTLLSPNTEAITQPAAARVDVQFSVDDSATRVLDALGRGDLTEAGNQAEVLISKQPGRWEGYFVKGSVLLAGGRTREAEAPLERALELQPNSVRVLLQRAIAAQESGQPVRAVDLLRRAKTIAPDNSAVWLNLGYSAELSNANDEAVAAYQRYLQLTNGRSGADSQRAYVGERLRNLGKP
jgi:Flp pilus assembly protein TadD